jgi:transcriptional regulator with XRE-family HTH domain
MYLNYQQLKAARVALNLGVREIGSLIETSGTTISKLENNLILLSDMRLGTRRNEILKEFFLQNYITFPDSNIISFSSNLPLEKNTNTSITRFQLRTARVLSKLTQSGLASLILSTSSLIMYYEKQKNDTTINPKDPRIIYNLINIFKEKSIILSSPNTVSFEKNS